MTIGKTVGTLALGISGLMNAADATAQETKTSPKQEPAKVVKFIADTNEATLASKSTNAELTGRARVEAATTKPREFTEAELKERAKLIEDFSHLLPTEKVERESFNERINDMNNIALRTLLKGSDFLIKEALLTSEQKSEFFRARSLNNSANVLGRAANVKLKLQDTDAGIINFITTYLEKIPKVNIASLEVENLDSQKFVNR